LKDRTGAGKVGRAEISSRGPIEKVKGKMNSGLDFTKADESKKER